MKQKNIPDERKVMKVIRWEAWKRFNVLVSTMRLMNKF
jgi:hypothetical protein